MRTPISGWRALPPIQKGLVAALALLLIVVQIDQPFPAVAPLHHLPTLTLLIAAPAILARWPMSSAAVACIAGFFMLHTIGGRWTYTNVPYDALAEALTGRSVSETFGFTRNHYDRLVHFAYGLLAVAPAREALVGHLGLGRRTALYIAVESVLAISLCYELFEWLLTLGMAGTVADRYNGQQGDQWDAQKDMALAALGACTAAAWLVVRRVGREEDGQ